VEPPAQVKVADSDEGGSATYLGYCKKYAIGAKLSKNSRHVAALAAPITERETAFIQGSGRGCALWRSFALLRYMVRILADKNMPGWADGQLKLREAIYWWIQKSTKAWEHTPWGGGHDEGIFTRTWMDYYLLTGDTTAYEFMDRMAHDFIDSPVVEACTCFLTPEDAAVYPREHRRPPYHGYCEDQACFVHAPENYAWYLTHMAHINPSPMVRQALEDCAEHVGNWCPETPEWYDWNNHRFRGALFGTGKVRDCPPYDFEPLALVRVMVMASNMYYLTGESKYLDVCVDWADKWAGIVLDADPAEGFCTTLFPCPDDEVDAKYGELARARHARSKLNYELGNLFMDLYYYTRQASYAQAVHKMLNTDPDWLRHPGGSAGVAGMLAAKYRSMTGDKSFDKRIAETADAMLLDESDNRPALLLMNKPSETFLDTPGLAYVRMFKDGRVELDNRRTGILTAAYTATLDTKYLEYAMGLALNRFYDSHYIWDGRELGCRGSWQGRNGVAIHNVIAPMMCSAMGGFGMLEGERPWFEVRYEQADGRPGLPKDVAALFVPGDPRQRVVKFYNRGETEQTVAVRADNTRAQSPAGDFIFDSATLDGKPVDGPLVPVTIAPGGEHELRIGLK